MQVSKKFVLHFPTQLINQPITCQMIRKYKFDFNILKAEISPGEEGLLVMELNGEEEELNKAIRWLKKMEVGIQLLSQDVVRLEDRCTYCGACIPICPSAAFSYDEATIEVLFDQSKCIACGLCIRACPYRAMEVRF